MPTVLHVVIAIATTGYAVGSEFGRRSLEAWLHCAGGSPLSARLARCGRVFPSEAAIDGLVRVNQMGASLLRGLARLDGLVGARRRLPRPFRSVRALRRGLESQPMRA